MPSLIKRIPTPIIVITMLTILTLIIFGISTEVVADKPSVTITILQTSDIHGMINPYNYADDEETTYSMAHIATVISEERESDPDLLLIDTGDISHNNYVQEFRKESIHPAIDALNYLKYDVWTPGNHEFNYEFETLEKEIADFKGKTLIGNAYTEEGTRWQEPWYIFEIKGIKVAIFGITNPNIPQMEQGNSVHYNDMTFTEPIDEVGKILDELEGQCDVIIGNIHYGLDGNYESQGVRAIAQTYGDRLDGLLIGHAHKIVNTTLNNVWVIEPSKNGKYVSKLTITLEKENGVWTVNKNKTQGQLINVSLSKPDKDFLTHFKALHEKSLLI